MADEDIWFEPKRFGYGAGLPVAWQGWALLGGYCALLASLGSVLKAGHPALFIALAALVTVPLVVVAAQHTRGGWRWRWGE